MSRGLGVAALACVAFPALEASAQTADAPQPSSPAASAPAAAASAPNDQPAQLSNVTVSARRRNEPLQSVPVTVSAFSEAQMERLQADTATALSGKSPNVQIVQTGAGTGALQVFIRGVGQDSLAFNSENPVGIYLDDVYMGRVQGALLGILDFERIEILRGPQGTLYGRNSTVGAFKYVTKQPDLEEAHYRTDVTFGSRHEFDTLLSASVPLIDKELAFKLDVGTRNQDGYLDIIDTSGNKTGGHANNIDNRVARLAVRWVPDARLSADFTADYGIDRSGSTTGSSVTCVDPVKGPCSNTYGSPYPVGDNGANKGHNDSSGVSARIQYAWDTLTLKSISAYRSTKNLDEIDFTGAPGGSALVLPDSKDQSQYSQEFQLANNSGPLRWLTGLFYFHEDIQHDADFLGYRGDRDHQKSDSAAVFAEGTYALTSDLNVTLGGRYSYDRKTIDRAILPGTAYTGNLTGSGSFDTKKFTYKLGADYKITENLLGYVTYATGYRPGAFSQTYPDPSTPTTLTSFTKTETVKNVELGLKSEVFNHRLRLNAAAFVEKYTDLQNQSSTPPFPILSKDVGIKGVELEFDARPLREWSVYGNVGYLHSVYDTGVNEGLTTRYSPKTQGSIGTEYRIPFREDAHVFVGGNIVYTASFRTDDQFLASVEQPSYTLFGARLGAEFQGGKYRVTLEGRNLSNKEYFLSTNPGAARWFAPPRSFALTLSARI